MKSRKILFVFSLVLIILFLNITNCFASTSVTYDDINYILPDNIGQHYMIGFNYDKQYVLFYTDSLDFCFKLSRSQESNGWTELLGFKNSNLSERSDFNYIIGKPTGDGVIDFTVNNPSIKGNYGCYIKHSNITIYDVDNSVFYQAPVQGIVAQKLEGTEMSQVLQEIIIILPLIIVILVSLVGFRKALAMLFSLLNKA